VDVNLLVAGEESSMEEFPEEHFADQPQISSEDDCKKEGGKASPYYRSVLSLPTSSDDASDEDTVEFPRASKDEIWDIDENTHMLHAGGSSSGRQTKTAAEGYKAGISLLGKPKVCC
jgi:hypothetical protein